MIIIMQRGAIMMILGGSDAKMGSLCSKRCFWKEEFLMKRDEFELLHEKEMNFMPAVL